LVFFGVLDGQFLMCYSDYGKSKFLSYWNFLDVSTDCPNLGDVVEKPEGFEEMVNIANILCEDFPCVRVDLYLVNHRVYFGELTFYPWTGYVQFEPDEFDHELGRMKESAGLVLKLRVRILL
jgi:hypothetical protein